jgi:hypothetical protein
VAQLAVTPVEGLAVTLAEQHAVMPVERDGAQPPRLVDIAAAERVVGSAAAAATQVVAAVTAVVDTGNIEVSAF